MTRENVMRRYRRNPSIVSKCIDGTWVILEADLKHVRKLNGTAGDVWGLLASPKTQTALVNAIVSLYDADKGEVETDISAFIRRYLRDGLLVEV